MDKMNHSAIINTTCHRSSQPPRRGAPALPFLPLKLTVVLWTSSGASPPLEQGGREPAPQSSSSSTPGSAGDGTKHTLSPELRGAAAASLGRVHGKQVDRATTGKKDTEEERDFFSLGSMFVFACAFFSLAKKQKVASPQKSKGERIRAQRLSPTVGGDIAARAVWKHLV